MNLNLRFILRSGLIAGGILLYTSVIGMLVSFSERQVILDLLTLGQMLLFFPPAVAGYYVARHTKNPFASLIGGVLTGIVSSLPLLVLLFLNNHIAFRTILVNVSRDLITVLTFDSDSQLTGGLLLAAFITASSVFGAIFTMIPHRLRRALLIALGCTLTIGVLGQLTRQLLQQALDRASLDTIFRREVLRPGAAVAIFTLIFATSLFWSYQGQYIRSRFHALPNNQQRNVRRGGISLLGLLLLFLPWLIGTAASDVMTNVGLYILMGLGLNIAVGMAGLLDLGYVTNFAVGAYVMGVLTSTSALGFEARTGAEIFNFWLVLPISLFIAMLTGFFFALPVLKMRGDYLAIATLGFGEIIRVLAFSDWLAPVIGGAQGVLFIPKPVIFGIELNRVEHIYYIILTACLLAVFVSTRLNNSRIGRQWMAIREDEDVAAAMGINTAKSKLLAFTLSAATGGVAGAIFATKLGTIFPNSFALLVSINVLSLIIVGGIGSIPGIIVGAFALIGLPELLREFDEFRLLLYGALLIVMMLLRPEGLWPSAVHRREMHQEESTTSGAQVTTAPEDEKPALVAGD